MFLSIVIAIYNEEENMNELTGRIYNSMNSLKIPFELIYVIDGTDNSLNIVNNLKKSKNNLILDYSHKPRGFKNAFVKGFSLVNKNATHILTMDGDLNHQPEEIHKFIQKMNDTGSDVVVGSRYIKNGMIENPLWKKGVSIFANYIIKFIWKIDIQDKTSGYRLYKKQVVDTVIPYCKANGFEFLSELLIQTYKMGYKIVESPIIFIPRKRGTSKFKFFKTAKGYLELYLSRKNNT